MGFIPRMTRERKFSRRVETVEELFAAVPDQLDLVHRAYDLKEAVRATITGADAGLLDEIRMRRRAFGDTKFRDKVIARVAEARNMPPWAIGEDPTQHMLEMNTPCEPSKSQYVSISYEGKQIKQPLAVWQMIATGQCNEVSSCANVLLSSGLLRQWAQRRPA